MNKKTEEVSEEIQVENSERILKESLMESREKFWKKMVEIS